MLVHRNEFSVRRRRHFLLLSLIFLLSTPIVYQQLLTLIPFGLQFSKSKKTESSVPKKEEILYTKQIRARVSEPVINATITIRNSARSETDLIPIQRRRSLNTNIFSDDSENLSPLEVNILFAIQVQIDLAEDSNDPDDTLGDIRDDITAIIVKAIENAFRRRRRRQLLFADEATEKETFLTTHISEKGRNLMIYDDDYPPEINSIIRIPCEEEQFDNCYLVRSTVIVFIRDIDDPNNARKEIISHIAKYFSQNMLSDNP